jgi:transcriptional regulator with XRE-family HTH domain
VANLPQPPYYKRRRKEGCLLVTFAQKLQQSRTHTGLTQAQLAERSGLGLGTIRDYEQGNREPSLRSAAMLAKALGVSVEMFADSGNPKTKTTAATKGPGRPKKASADAAGANVAGSAGDAPQVKPGAAKKGRRRLEVRKAHHPKNAGN